MSPGFFQDAADHIKSVGAAIEREFRLGAAFARQLRHAFGIDIGRIGNNQVVTRLGDRPEQIAAMQSYALAKTVIGNIARGDIERVL